MLVAALLTMTSAAAPDADARRPFYVIAHCANDATEVREAIDAGANGVEIDVPIREGRLLARHGGLEPMGCGGRTSSDELPALFRQVAVAMRSGDLALLVVDAKETEGSGVVFGRLLGQALGEADLPSGHVVVSIPMDQGASVRQGLLEAGYDARIDLYLDDYGTTDPGRWLEALRLAEADVAGVGMDPIAFWRPMPWWHAWMAAMTARRDRGTGPSFTYYWTINEPASARAVLDHGLDGLITNDPARILPLLDAPPYRQVYRLATSTEGVP